MMRGGRNIIRQLIRLLNSGFTQSCLTIAQNRPYFAFLDLRFVGRLTNANHMTLCGVVLSLWYNLIRDMSRTYNKNATFQPPMLLSGLGPRAF